MSSSIPFTTQSNADASKGFKWRKRGANKIYWWVMSGKCLQDKYQKHNFIGENCKAKCAKTWKMVHKVRSMTTSTFEYKFVLRIWFIVKVTAGCSVLVWYIIINMTRCFGTKNSRNHLAGLLTSSITLGIQRSFAFYAR